MRIKIFDEIKALSIIAVVLFHLGCFKYGYLGVDVFLVIAGYLTMQSVSRSIEKDSFSVVSFIFTRVRRLLPLVLIACGVSLILGFFLMLPDDFENLSQSIVASSFFGNNILCQISSGDYWAQNNDYKPLLHFWYLGALMQLYIFFALIVAFCRKKVSFIYGVVTIVGILSALMVFLGIGSQPFRFYYMPWRFYEFAIGVVLFAIIPRISDKITLKIPFLDVVGKASLSVYVWHYVFLAFWRYAIGPSCFWWFYVGYIGVLAIVSKWSYNKFEVTNNSQKLPLKRFLVYLILAFTIINGVSLYIVNLAGIVRDVPELDVYKGTGVRGLHNKYNERIRALKPEFPNNNKINVLVIGNSYGRDWANVLLESEWAEKINIVYSSQDSRALNVEPLLNKAHVIFLAGVYIDKLPSCLRTEHGTIKVDGGFNVYVVGDKWFGVSNGMFYNRRWLDGYFKQVQKIPEDFALKLQEERKLYGSR